MHVLIAIKQFVATFITRIQNLFTKMTDILEKEAIIFVSHLSSASKWSSGELTLIPESSLVWLV